MFHGIPNQSLENRGEREIWFTAVGDIKILTQYIYRPSFLRGSGIAFLRGNFTIPWNFIGEHFKICPRKHICSWEAEPGNKSTSFKRMTFYVTWKSVIPFSRISSVRSFNFSTATVKMILLDFHTFKV